MDDVVLLLEYPHAAAETDVIETMDVLEIAQAYGPES